MEKKTKEVKSEKKPVKAKDSVLVLDVLDSEGKPVEKFELPREIFGVKPNKQLIAQAIRVYLANQRLGNAKTKTRGAVSGGGKKPWRQKGTGRARIGSIRAPHWRGGGVTHGPVERDFSLKLPKKMKRAALISALSEKLASKEIVLLKDIKFKEPKTKLANSMIKKLAIEGKKLIVMPEITENEYKALRNLAQIRLVKATDLNTYEVLNNKNLLLTKEAVSKMESVLLGK